MKKALLFFVLLFTLQIHSQHILKDSIIYLDEVVVSKKATKHKTVKVKTDGNTIGQVGAQKIPAQVSLLNHIPAGILSYVTFYFNSGTINVFKKESDVVYEDTELGLVLYTVNKDGTPGAPLLETPLRFMVKKEHRGSIKLNLEPLHLSAQPQLFIGMESVSEQQANTVILKMQKNDNAVTYNRGKDGKWYKFDFGDLKVHIKMEVGIEIE
jgi:hypothetical protein